MNRVVTGIIAAAIAAGSAVSAQTINEYVIPRADGTLTMDGVLDEASWAAAPYTEGFVTYAEGNEPQFPTRAKMLWDDTNLYVAFEMTDNDIWSTMTQHDGGLYREEVAEIFIDPDNDTYNYVEIEVNPLGTIFDLWLEKTWSEGGPAHTDWTCEGFDFAVSIDGTINDDSDTDNGWILECAIPFADIAFSATEMQFPPNPGDTWRMNLYRFERQRPTETGLVEETGWNQTDDRQFHAPELFGRVTFGGVTTGMNDIDVPAPVRINGNFPNPFNPSTAIEFTLDAVSAVSMDVYSVGGQKVESLVDGVLNAGVHHVVWDANDINGTVAPSGAYLVCLRTEETTATHRMLLMK